MIRNSGLLCLIMLPSLLSAQTPNDNPQLKDAIKRNLQARAERAAVPRHVVDQYKSLEFQGMPYRFLPLEKPALDTKYPLILSLHGGGGKRNRQSC